MKLCLWLREFFLKLFEATSTYEFEADESRDER
jgi:hypothetical protein